jgi:undecaprenyl-diphosphatase
MGDFIQLSLFQAILLGTIQGLTEFLPVSSSGHLVLFQHFFGIRQPELFFDVCLHAGTLLATVLVFFQEIRSILVTMIRIPALNRRAGGIRPLFDTNEDFRILVLIVAGSIPTGILGLLFKEVTDSLFSNLPLVGIMLIVTGTLLWVTRRLETSGRPVSKMGIKDALIVGFVQGLAIIPGISRSGSTISVALLLNIDRETAGRFSFLLSLPAIAAATVLMFESGIIEESSASIPALFGGTLASTAIGYIALKILLRIVKHGRFHLFSPYCWAVGALALILSWH